MNTKMRKRSLFGLSLGVLVWTLCLTNPLQGAAASSGANLIRPGAAMMLVAAEPQQVSPAYRAGRQAGRADAERDLPRNPRNSRWITRQDRSDYVLGYNQAYSEVLDLRENGPGYARRDEPNYERDRDYRDRDYRDRSLERENTNINIGRDNVIRWQAPATVRVYVQVDNEPLKLFAEGASGSQAAPWIQSGHSYQFIVQDLNGNEITRDRLDLRRSRR
jgi:hypothetical protein